MPRNTSDKFKTARQKNKRRQPRTTVNSIVKRALNSTGMSSSAMAFRRASRATGDLGYVDIAAAAYALDTTGTITHLNVVAQGASTSQRVGKKIVMTSLQFRGSAVAGSAGATCNAVFMIVYDKRPTGSLPAITDILNAVNANAQNKDDNVPSRFMILKRETIALIGNSTTPATGSELFNKEFYLPMRLPVVYKALGTGAIGDVEEGALYLVTASGTAAGTGAGSLNGTFRVRYIDN